MNLIKRENLSVTLILFVKRKWKPTLILNDGKLVYTKLLPRSTEREREREREKGN